MRFDAGAGGAGSSMTITNEFLTIAAASERIRRRELSPVELTRALLERIQALDPQVNAFITVTPELALDQARNAEAEIAAGRSRGALHGIPFGLKDIYDTAGIRTTAHSKIYAGRVPHEDAALVSRLYAAGGVLLGKLGTHEFAIGGPSHDLPWPIPRNPWQPEHYVGGSSSGSAAAVAAGFVLGALGSDTGASIRNPAALAGIVGMKPTFGLLSRRGVIPNAYTFDTCGPMAWTVEDCAIMLQALAGHDPADPASLTASIPDYRRALGEDLRGLRIGVIRHFWEEDLPTNPHMRRAMDEAVDVLGALGAACENVRVRAMGAYHDVRMVIGQTEVFCNHQADLTSRPADFGAELLRKVLPACLFQGAHYVQAQRERRIMLDELAPIYARYDALLTAASGPAPRLDAFQGIDFWSKPNIYNIFNLTGGPALSICNGYSPLGLPLGMQIAGAPFRDATVLRVAHAYEKATSWRSRRPTLPASGRPDPVNVPPEPTPELDTATRQWVEAAAEKAGITLHARSAAMLLSAAPYALAMASRIPRTRPREVESASVFVFPPSGPSSEL
jgi:aspartyl-tRNA(Asn)/glutamyl-tRNA(Gln) amidotransferase subunit A